LRWAVEDKIKYGYRAGYADIVLQAVEEMIRVLRALVESYPEEQRPSDYQIVRQAVANLDIVGFGLRETEKKQPDRATALR
jgi:hypothetical protein